jgi:hypothetical protein
MTESAAALELHEANDAAPAPLAAPILKPVESNILRQSERVDDLEDIPNSPQHYIAGLALLGLLALGALAVGNRLLAPWLHMPSYIEGIAATLHVGDNYGVFDLNVDIRGIRRGQFAAMEKAPEVMLLGASHWQEGSADLMPNHEMFNAHVHRDYYDDIVAAVGLMAKNDLWPQTVVVSIRDQTFRSVANRTDYLWLPWIPDYLEAESALGIEPRPFLENFQPHDSWSLFSLTNFSTSAEVWLSNAGVPGPTKAELLTDLDILMADGSIRWSQEHIDFFTRERARVEALDMARKVRDTQPEMNEHAIAAVDGALARLKAEGVEVILVHPPFNPIFYDRIADSTFEQGLADIHALTVELADRHGFATAGSFSPYDMGCTSSMYIDAEHSGPSCLGRVFSDIAKKIKR